MIDAGRVTIGGRPAAKHGVRLRPGDTVEADVAPPPADPRAPAPRAAPLSVIHEDADVVVVDKAAGVVTHPAPGHETGTLVEAVLARYPEIAGVGSERRPGVVHRLDRDTSGAIAFARTNAAYYALTEQLRRRTLRRFYLAVAEGSFDEDEGTVEAPIGRDGRDRKRMSVRPDGRPARTRYRVVERFRRAALLEVSLETGRTHQIRVHLAHIGHPVVGDGVYGRGRIPFARQALHAHRLVFVSPSGGRRVEVVAPIPADMAALVGRLRAG